MASSQTKKKNSSHDYSIRKTVIVWLMGIGLLYGCYQSGKSSLLSLQAKNWPVCLGTITDKGFEMGTADNGSKYKDWHLEYAFFLHGYEYHDDNIVMGIDEFYMPSDDMIPEPGTLIEVHYRPDSFYSPGSFDVCLDTSVNWLNVLIFIITLFSTVLILNSPVFGEKIPLQVIKFTGRTTAIITLFSIASILFGFYSDRTKLYRPDTLKICMTHAKLGDAQYQARLGKIYLEGNLVEKNEKEGIKWYMQALKGKDINAAMELGEFLLKKKTEYPDASSLVIEFEETTSKETQHYLYEENQKKLLDIVVGLLRKQNKHSAALKLYQGRHKSMRFNDGRTIKDTISREAFLYFDMLGDMHDDLGDSNASLKAWDRAQEIGSRNSLAPWQMDPLQQKIKSIGSSNNSSAPNIDRDHNSS